jgi:hypothetical protein
MNNKSKQMSLFPQEKKQELWEKEWTGMPEFIQEDLTSFRSIILHFRNQEDIEEFSKLIDQKIPPKQKYLWYPKLETRTHVDKIYVDKNES